MAGNNNFDDFVTRKRIDLALPESYEGDGGQVITIPEYSPVRVDGEHEGKVAYDYPHGNFYAYDSPFDFVYKMLRQRENIKAFYTAYSIANPDETKVTIENGTEINLNLLQEWENLWAPGNEWREYITTDNSGYEPFLPGTGLYWKSDKHDNLSVGLEGADNAEDHATFNAWFAQNPEALSAGVDCVGFAIRSASYSDSTYVWGKIAGNITEGAEADSRSGNIFPLVGTYSYTISDSDEKYINEDKTDYYNLEKAVPGDIIFYHNTEMSRVIIFPTRGNQESHPLLCASY